MLRKLMFVALAGLFMMPAVAMAQPEAGRWELTLVGSGSNDNDFVDGSFRFDAGLGYYLSKELEVGVRQGVDWVNSNGDDTSFSTVVFADYHFDLGQWQPFVGVLFGGLYGDNTNDTFLAGLEAGVKYYVNKTTFIFARAEYDFLFDDSDDADEAFDDGRFVYGLGIGFLF